MATLTPTNPTPAGVALSYAAASAGGDVIACGNYRNVKLFVRNASASPITVTLTGVVKCSQGSTHNTVVSCAVGDTELSVPAQCIDPSLNQVGVAYSASASVTVAALAE